MHATPPFYEFKGHSFNKAQIFSETSSLAEAASAVLFFRESVCGEKCEKKPRKLIIKYTCLIVNS
jgi:hypothetical protein